MFNPIFPGMDMHVGVRELVGITVIYAYVSYTMMVLAYRLGLKDSWFAWVPFLNLYLLTKMAGQPWWYIFGLVVPYVHFFMYAYIWSAVAARLLRHPLIGAAIVLPYIGLLVPGYLVITGTDRAADHHKKS